MMSGNADSTAVVLTLFFILVILVLLLFYLYKRLNHETEDKYTIRQLVLGEGGLRDRVMQGIAVVEARLGDRESSQTHDEEQALNSNEDGKSGKEDEEEKEGVGKEDLGQGHSENEKSEEKEEEQHDDSSEDCSSTDLSERVKQNNSKEEEKKEEQEKEEAAKDEVKEDDSKQEEDVKNEERVGLLVDLKTFSGSAIWSEEKKEEPNVTAL